MISFSSQFKQSIEEVFIVSATLRSFLVHGDAAVPEKFERTLHSVNQLVQSAGTVLEKVLILVESQLKERSLGSCRVTVRLIVG